MTGTTYNLSRPNGYGGAGEVLDQRNAHSLTEALRQYRPGDTLISRPATGADMLTPWTPVTAAELDALSTEGMPHWALRKLSDYRRGLDAPAPAPISSQAGLASIRGGIVATAPGHFPMCQGCNGECGV